MSIIQDKILEIGKEIEKLRKERKDAIYEKNHILNKGTEDGDYWRIKRDEITLDIEDKKEKLSLLQELEPLVLDKKEVEEKINKYILTDLQGHPKPECKILWELKSSLGLEEEKKE